MMASPVDRMALWRTLLNLPANWAALPEEGVILPEGTPLRRSNAPDGTLYLGMTFHASEDFEALLDGRGPYTEEELEDPYAVIDGRWEEAGEVMQTLLAEATQVLDEPDHTGVDAPQRVNWSLDDRTITVGLFQADKECPIEVCLWLLAPGLTPDSLGL